MGPIISPGKVETTQESFQLMSTQQIQFLHCQTCWIQAEMFWGRPGMETQHESFQPLPADTCLLSWVPSQFMHLQAALFLTGDKVQLS